MKEHSGPMFWRRSFQRSGFSLVEAVSMIMLLGSMMSLTGMAIHRASQTQKLVLSSIRQVKSLDDLHHRLLIDTRAASQLTVVNDAIWLQQVDGPTIEYSCDAGQIVRKVNSTSNQLLGQNRWRINARKFQAEVDASGSVPLARYNLIIDRQPTDASVAPAAVVSAADDSSLAKESISLPIEVDSVRWIVRLGVEQ